ncbi:alpha-L-rhamnosidase C [Hirsutella rhossiliensis]|uniref:Alpha-L-rhamnosidase C n=1 Tax=Hirsutella rhossiliensis TaxID=111463 RepID=A0A9P8MYT8_9HYPO|nr:alpha-L-rhamnosidase C [Hirsutella rhossiliensis]KAH0962786.1 alpha-L-rhamnosidase C [Hirsutella rhossiliensis]
MNHPSADDDDSPRKMWIEIDSQILNALFCVTAFGLAPLRFRDLYWFVRAVHFKDETAMRKLANQTKSWFRPPLWARQNDEATTVKTTFTGQVAPPTPVWKLGFTIWMMVLNTLLQAVLCFYMWHYDRIDRPSWATGTFIALGCGVAMLAGLMSWWEGRKVKNIEGPEVTVV